MIKYKEWYYFLHVMRFYKIEKRYKVINETHTGLLLLENAREYFQYVQIFRSSDKCYRVMTTYWNLVTREDKSSYKSFREIYQVVNYLNDLLKNK